MPFLANEEDRVMRSFKLLASLSLGGALLGSIPCFAQDAPHDEPAVVHDARFTEDGVAYTLSSNSQGIHSWQVQLAREAIKGCNDQITIQVMPSHPSRKLLKEADLQLQRVKWTCMQREIEDYRTGNFLPPDVSLRRAF